MVRRDAARAIVRCGRRLWEAGLIAGADGNISVRLDARRVLVTPRGLPKADLRPGDLVTVNLAGERVAGYHLPTSELDLHLRIYRSRPETGAVVHAHPPVATGLAVAGESLPGDVLPEVILLFGEVPLVPYATPGTPALGDLVETYVHGHDGLLLANHGAVCWGSDLRIAQIRMESLEHAARILLAARAAGRVGRLSPAQVHELAQVRGLPPYGQIRSAPRQSRRGPPRRA